MGAGYTMTDPLKIPASTQWALVSGGALSWRLLSDIGGKLTDADMVPINANSGELELRVHGIQSYCIAKNNSFTPVRLEVRLIYIPNLNAYTTGAVDYLVPRATMFFKSGTGCGNLIYRGYNKRELAASDATGIPVKYQTLDKKVIYLPAATFTGTQNVGGTLQQLLFNAPVVYKRFNLKHYYKGMGKKGFCRSLTSQKQLSDGNYFLVYWSDAPALTETVSFLSSNNMQFSIKQNMNAVT